MNDIAFDLCTMRKDVGLTQKQLAEILGVKQSNISRWERPGYNGYKVSILSKLARVLGGRLELSLKRSTDIMLDLSRFTFTENTHRFTQYTDGHTETLQSSRKIKFEGVKIYA
ncbi:helix-turn-helix transcriptional regulator, partial [Candidatus Saccharibacteria bacterium]|nr:helix-turn-helix transcriptional regulator [Candidatus Saccharibacteria bacterium]